MFTRYSTVFETLRHGSLLDELQKFDNEQLRPFLPILMLSGFHESSTAGVDEKLNSLRTRLIGFLVGNQFLRFMRLNFPAIERMCRAEIDSGRSEFSSFSKVPFQQMNEEEKVRLICLHLLFRMKESELSNIIEKFEPFDSEIFHEEVTWIITLFCSKLPNIFTLSMLSKYLLNYGSASRLIPLLVMNQPDAFNGVLDSFIKLRSADDDSFIAKQTTETAMKLFELEPSQAQQYVSELLENDVHLKRSVQMLCSASLDDKFFVDTLIAQLANRTSKFTNYVTKGANRNALKRVCVRVDKVLLHNSKRETELDGRVILLMALLSSFSTFKMLPEESQQWIRFLTRPSQKRTILLKTSLATILACPNLMQDQVSFRDELIQGYLTDFFSQLRQQANLPEHASLSQMMLLIAIHMITEKAEDLANLLSSVLGYKVSKTFHKQQLVRKLYLEHAVTDRDIAVKAANISITEGLNAKRSGYLPVHCISYLLYSRAFSKYDIPIQDWIKRQLRECSVPVHPSVSHLLEYFAISCIPTDEFRSFNQTIDKQFFWDIFSGDLFDESRTVLRVLAMFYMVTYTYMLDTANVPKDIAGTKSAPISYSQELWAIVPVRHLLVMVDSHYADFYTIRPKLLQYITCSMQHLLPDLDCTLSIITDEITKKLVYRKCSVSDGQLTSALEKVCTSRDNSELSGILEQLEWASIQKQYRHFDSIVRAIQRSLDGTVPRPLVDKITALWQRLENLVPRRLYEDTLRLWLQGSHAANGDGALRVDANLLLAETPTILFRVDERVFKSPPHFRCFLRILSFYLEASRNANYTRLVKANAHSSKVEMDEKNHLLRSFIGTQHLTVVQILIELCDGNQDTCTDLEEIRQIACAQIHQMFIADAQLPKLVHFNTYPLHLIPVIVKGVPSAHVLIGCIGELLVSGNLQRRIFGITLITELVEQYKITPAFSALTLVSDLLDTLISSVVNEELVVLMLHIVPSLGRLIRISTFHAEHFLATILRFRKILISRLAVYKSLITARKSPEQRLIELIDQTLDECRNFLPQTPQAQYLDFRSQ